jgi:hypothetical protein
MDTRKKAVSIRIGASDLRSVKRLAKRLGARDSDVIRTAVKLLLGRLAPLHDPNIKGRNLMPVFLESGADLFRHFDLDAPRLESIVNEGVEAESRVDAEDIQLLAMTGVQRTYVKLRLEHLGTANVVVGDASTSRVQDEDQVEQSLRQYLYDKYLYKGQGFGKSHSQVVEKEGS